MQGDEVAHEREPDAEPAASALERMIALHEHVEDLVPQFGRDADPGIPHANPDVVWTADSSATVSAISQMCPAGA